MKREIIGEGGRLGLNLHVQGSVSEAQFSAFQSFYNHIWNALICRLDEPVKALMDVEQTSLQILYCKGAWWLIEQSCSIDTTEHYKLSSSSGDTVNLSLEETVFAPGQLLLFQSE